MKNSKSASTKFAPTCYLLLSQPMPELAFALFNLPRGVQNPNNLKANTCSTQLRDITCLYCRARRPISHCVFEQCGLANHTCRQTMSTYFPCTLFNDLTQAWCLRCVYQHTINCIRCNGRNVSDCCPHSRKHLNWNVMLAYYDSQPFKFRKNPKRTKNISDTNGKLDLQIGVRRIAQPCSEPGLRSKTILQKTLAGPHTLLLER